MLRRHYRKAALLCWLVVMPLLAGASDVSTAPLRIVLGEDSRENQCESATGALLRELLQLRNGIAFECSVMPWQRAQLSVKSGERDALVALPTTERLQYAVASQVPVIKARMVAFTRADHPQMAALRLLRTPIDAKPYRILSYRADGWAQQQLVPLGLAIEWSEDSATVLKKLAAARGDLFFQNDVDTRRLIRQLGLEQTLLQLPMDFGRIDRHLLIRRDHPATALLPKLDASLRQMHADGSIKRIEQQYR